MGVALLIDDEPQNVEWLADYLRFKSLDVEYATSVDEGVGKINGSTGYRVIVIDLNMPVSEAMKSRVSALGDEFAKYPGAFVAKTARTKGYRDRQVVVYSVHDEPKLRQFLSSIRCTYLTKGRPKQIKEELEAVISFDPSSE